MAMAAVDQLAKDAIKAVNDSCREKAPFELIAKTAGATLALAFAYGQLTSKHPLHKRLRKAVFRTIRQLPFVKRRVEEEVGKFQADCEKEHVELVRHLDEMLQLPENGMTEEEVLEFAKKHAVLGESNWKMGHESGTVYNGNETLTDLMTKVYGMTAWSNPLHPGAFPGVRKMEAEVVRMCCEIFNGGPRSCGAMTNGGTESIVLAVKAYRDWAREEKGVNHPNIVIPESAHAAFVKAGDILDIVVRTVRCDPETKKVDLRAMRWAIDSSTCMLMGSCPGFPHGIIDDIEGIAELGLRYGVPVHVDACLGGFLVPFMKDAGYPIKPFDFSVPGVTSISADTHKYGFAPKGSSVVLYSDPAYRRYQWFTTVDWSGGIYATATIGGSRAGGIIAACWASLIYHGKNGYVESTRKIVKTTRRITRELRDVEGLKVIGDPKVSVVAIASDAFNIYGLSEKLKERGWSLNNLQFPPSVHMCVTLIHTENGIADRFVQDVRECARFAMSDPAATNTSGAVVYGMTASIPDRGLVGKIAWGYLDALYVTKSSAIKKVVDGESHKANGSVR